MHRAKKCDNKYAVVPCTFYPVLYFIVYGQAKKQLVKLFVNTYATKFYWSLVPGPFFVIQLVLKSWSKLDSDVARFVKSSSLILSLALVQSVIRSVDFVDNNGRLSPE